MKNKKVLTKEEFVEQFLNKTPKILYKTKKKRWSKNEEKNTTKVKYRW